MDKYSATKGDNNKQKANHRVKDLENVFILFVHRFLKPFPQKNNRDVKATRHTGKIIDL